MVDSLGLCSWLSDSPSTKTGMRTRASAHACIILPNSGPADNCSAGDTVKKNRNGLVDHRGFPWSLWPSLADAIDTPYGLSQDTQEFRPADESR
jgi:hypothetical protein